MNAFRFLTYLGLLAGTACALAATNAERPNMRPNIILVTADDLGMQLGSYGDEIVATPRLDRFAAEGVRFSHAYVTQSSCSPSRSSLLTGLYPHQNGQIGLENRGYAMSVAFPTAPTLLHQAGYRTGIIGKLHVAPAAAFHFEFDRTVDHATLTRDRAAMRSMVDDFLDATDGRPFFFMVNYFDPHAPFLPQVAGLPADPADPAEVEPWAFQGGIDSEPIRRRIADYYSCVERLDALFGDLLDALTARGLDENTLVIFISDNGPPFALAKATELDASVHVPLMVRWPGIMQPGAVSLGLVSGVDVFATVLDAAGVEQPEGTESAKSLRPLMKGKVPGDWRRYVGTEFTAHQPFAFYPRRSVTDGKYRLVRNLMAGSSNPYPDVDEDDASVLSQTPAYAGSVVRMVFDRHLQPPPIELYDLRSDPHCLYNLAEVATYAPVRAQLMEALAIWMETTDDPLRVPQELERLRQKHAASGGVRWPESFN